MLKGEAVEQKDAEDAMEGRARVSKKACVAAGLFCFKDESGTMKDDLERKGDRAVWRIRSVKLELAAGSFQTSLGKWLSQEEGRHE